MSPSPGDGRLYLLYYTKKTQDLQVQRKKKRGETDKNTADLPKKDEKNRSLKKLRFRSDDILFINPALAV